MNNTCSNDAVPLISILLPLYNAELKLSEAIQSIINQSFRNWELLLINNGSEDSSVKLAQEFCRKDSRIILINEPSTGIVNALNTGLLHCRGAYIARMDADDISLPDRLYWQYQFMINNPDIDLSSGLVRYLSENSDSKGYKMYVDWINGLMSHEQIYLNQFIESPLAHPSVIFSRKALLQYGTYRDGKFPEDYEMWLRWLNMGAKFQKIDKEILLWYDHPQRLSRIDNKYSKNAFNNVRIHYLDLWLKKHNPFYPEIAVWGAGKIGNQNAAKLEKLGHKVIFFVDVASKKIAKQNCISYTDLPEAGKFFIVNFVGNRGAAPLIKKELISKGYVEGSSFIMGSGI